MVAGEKRGVNVSIWFKDIGKIVWCMRNVEWEWVAVGFVKETNNDDTFTFLRKSEIKGIQNLPFNMIAKFVQVFKDLKRAGQGIQIFWHQIMCWI